MAIRIAIQLSSGLYLCPICGDLRGTFDYMNGQHYLCSPDRVKDSPKQIKTNILWHLDYILSPLSLTFELAIRKDMADE